MEVASAALMPVGLAVCAYLAGGRLGWLSLVAMVPMSALLVIGGLYWRAKLLQLDGDGEALAAILPVADRAQRPLGGASVAVAGLVGLAWFRTGLSAGLADRIVASAAAGLALAEYVNYFHRQLQHFDHRPDLRRLLAGRGFRPAKLNRDLARHRSTRSS